MVYVSKIGDINGHPVIDISYINRVIDTICHLSNNPSDVIHSMIPTVIQVSINVISPLVEMVNSFELYNIF